MANLSNIYYLSAAQWQQMMAQGYIIVDSVRYDYNENNIYYVKEDVPEQELPVVTSSDNGKALQVINGAWATGIDLATKADLVEGKVPSNQLPSYVDDVVEYPTLADFPATGESGKIYIALDTNKTYRWGGSTYVEIGSSLALGETESTAYRGDRGKAAYDHSQITTGNPHSVTYTDVGIVPNNFETTTASLNTIKLGDTNYKINALPRATAADAGKTVCVDENGIWQPSYLAVTHTYATTIRGDGTTTLFNLIHNLNSYDVLVQVYNNTTKATVVTESNRPTLNTVNIEFAEAPANGSEYRVLIYGMSVSIINRADT